MRGCAGARSTQARTPTCRNPNCAAAPPSPQPFTAVGFSRTLITLPSSYVFCTCLDQVGVRFGWVWLEFLLQLSWTCPDQTGARFCKPQALAALPAGQGSQKMMGLELRHQPEGFWLRSCGSFALLDGPGLTQFRAEELVLSSKNWFCLSRGAQYRLPNTIILIRGNPQK